MELTYKMTIEEYMSTLLEAIKSLEISLEEAEEELIDYLEYNHQKCFI